MTAAMGMTAAICMLLTWRAITGDVLITIHIPNGICHLKLDCQNLNLYHSLSDSLGLHPKNIVLLFHRNGIRICPPQKKNHTKKQTHTHQKKNPYQSPMGGLSELCQNHLGCQWAEEWHRLAQYYNQSYLKSVIASLNLALKARAEDHHPWLSIL